MLRIKDPNISILFYTDVSPFLVPSRCQLTPSQIIGMDLIESEHWQPVCSYFVTSMDLQPPSLPQRNRARFQRLYALFPPIRSLRRQGRRFREMEGRLNREGAPLPCFLPTAKNLTLESPGQASSSLLITPAQSRSL